jgi:hypothetical protein
VISSNGISVVFKTFMWMPKSFAFHLFFMSVLYIW